MKEYLTFDDVQIVPGYSEVTSRDAVNTQAQFTRNLKVPNPLVGAPMDTVCGVEMVKTLAELGSVGCLHRFMDISDQRESVKALYRHSMHIPRDVPIVATVGATGDYMERAFESLRQGANVILIDVAHGDHIHVKNALTELNALKGTFNFEIIAGNVATLKAAQRLEHWGADAIRVGVGGGSMCETRIRTGVGLPQLSVISEIAEYGLSIPLISDGGIRYPGDVAKALAAGADTVMIGSLFAGTDEAPGELFISGQWPNETRHKVFRGSASAAAKISVNGAAKNVEGTAKMVPVKGSVVNVVSTIMDGVRSAMSYVGATTIQEFQTKVEFVRITHAGLLEAHPHGLR